MSAQMRLPFTVINSFTRTAFAGNPAAVVMLTENLPDNMLQAVARQLNLVETVFIVPASADVDFHLRYFTPRQELPVAGHPTLAALRYLQMHGLLPNREVRIATGAGTIKAWLDGDIIWMHQMPAKFRPVPTPTVEIAAACGLHIDDFLNADKIEVSDAGLGHIIVEIASQDALQRAHLNIQKLAEVCALSDAREMQIFTKLHDTLSCQISTRNLCPREGEEDPACGNGNAALGAWLARHKRLAVGDMLWAEQGHGVNRPAQIGIRRLPDQDDILVITIGGYGKYMADGNVTLA